MYGHAAYGCALCCGYATDARFWYDPLGIPDSGTADQGVEAPDMCEGGNLEDVSGSFYAHWTTQNSSIATVDSYGTHTGMGLGSTTTNTAGWLNNNDHPRHCPLVQVFPSGNDNVFVQVPTTLQMVSGSSSTSNVPSCTVTVNGVQHAAAGCQRQLKWQVMDQESPPKPIQIANISASDQLSNAGGTNTCGFPASGGITGTGYTDSNGQFPDTYSTCSTACLNGGSCQSTEHQTWTVGGHVLTGDVKTVVYTCSGITINGQ